MLNNRISKYMKQKLIKLQGERGKTTITVGNFNTTHSITIRHIRQKFSKDRDDLNITINARGSLVKNLPAIQEKRVGSLGQEDPLEKEMATHSSILAWKIPWTEELGGLQSMGSQIVGHDCATGHTHIN